MDITVRTSETTEYKASVFCAYNGTPMISIPGRYKYPIHGVEFLEDGAVYEVEVVEKEGYEGGHNTQAALGRYTYAPAGDKGRIWFDSSYQGAFTGFYPSVTYLNRVKGE